MELWFVMMNGEEVGPLQADSVIRGIEMGRVTATSMIRSSTSAEWTAAQQFPQFASYFQGRAATPAPTSAPMGDSGAFQSSSALSALVGQEVAGFRLTHMLGEGGMAVVFRGENALDATITRAIKVVRPELSSNPEFVKRFAEEARTLERLQHPNVVRFFGLRRERGLLIMELELLTGDSLVAYMKRAPRGLPVDDAIRVLSEASEGVAAAHAMGVVHRDLKPENLFLTAGPVKVLDFGIARAIDEADRAGKLTQVGTTLGTPAYMAPEVCNGATPSETTDVYALGLTLFEVLAGYHPLLPEGSARLSSAQIMFAHVNRAIPSIAEVRSDVPPMLAAIVARAVAKDPRERFQNAAALAAALRQARTTLPQHASDPGNPATRFDIPHIGSPMQIAGRASRPDLAGAGSNETSFAIPSIGQTPAGGRPSLASRGSNPGGGDTGFGLPSIDRTRTTGGAEVIQRNSSGGSSSKSGMILGVLGAIAVSGGLLFMLTHKDQASGRGEGGKETAAAAGSGSAAPGMSASGAAAAGQPAHADDEANHWIRVNPPPTKEPLLLGVPDNTPVTTRGIRYARKLIAPASPYDIQQHEVTWGEITSWLAKNTSFKVAEAPGIPADADARKLFPVTGIPWEGAHKYCKDIGGALPREDEWEYAARGPKVQAFPWGNDPLDLQRTNAFGGPAAKLKPVMSNDQDQTPVPDAVAIFDMAGNAREWTGDLYREDKPPRSASDESWVQDGNMSWRTVRGLPLDEKPSHGLEGYTSAYRSEMCGSGACPKGTEQRRQFVGFRCVRHSG